MEKSKHTAVVLVPGSSGFDTLTAPHPDKLKIKRIGNLCLPRTSTCRSSASFKTQTVMMIRAMVAMDTTAGEQQQLAAAISAATVMLEVVPVVAATGGGKSKAVGLPSGCGERRTTWRTECATRSSSRRSASSSPTRSPTLPSRCTGGMYRPRNIRSLAFDEVWSLSLLRAKSATGNR